MAFLLGTLETLYQLDQLCFRYLLKRHVFNMVLSDRVILERIEQVIL